MGIFADAVGAIMTGGVTGLAGAGLQFLGNYFKDKQDKKHQLEMRKLEMDSMKLEAELALSKAQQEAEASMAIAEQHAFEKSFDNDRATYTPANGVDPRATWFLVCIDFIRGLVRPLITLWFVYLLADLQAQVFKLTGGLEKMPAIAIEQLFNNIILTILYISTTVVLWWFGSRSQKMKSK